MCVREYVYVYGSVCMSMYMCVDMCVRSGDAECLMPIQFIVLRFFLLFACLYVFI